MFISPSSSIHSGQVVRRRLALAAAPTPFPLCFELTTLTQNRLKSGGGVLVAAWLVCLAHFACRPSRPIPGRWLLPLTAGVGDGRA